MEPHGHWPDLQSLIAVEALRCLGEQSTAQTRHFIFRGDGPVERPPEHWWVPSGRENSLHGVLDVAFQEDACRPRQGHAVLNRAVLRRGAHLLLRWNTRTKSGIENKRLKAGCNLAYREEILGF